MRRPILAVAVLLLGCSVPRGGTREVERDAGHGHEASIADRDADGVPDDVDVCPDDHDPGQRDADGDGLGDACDPDRDGDGVDDALDACPDVPDPEQADLDADGLGDVCDPDRDGDGVDDTTDVCPDTPDPAQADIDGDGVGDACDPDIDGDGVPNARDLCPVRAPSEPDEDGDGIADECDNCPLDSNPDQANADGDRLGDACEDATSSRFFRVAYLETFEEGFGDLVPDGDGFEVLDGAAHATAADEQTLSRALDPLHMGQRYVVHVRGRYVGPQGEGDAAAGSFGVLLRWTQTPQARVGYAMEVLASDGRALSRRYDGGGCGALMDEECVSPLIDRALGLQMDPGDAFVLRATAYGDALALELRTDASVTTHSVHDARHAVGGFGLRVREARVVFDAVAVYTP